MKKRLLVLVMVIVTCLGLSTPAFMAGNMLTDERSVLLGYNDDMAIPKSISFTDVSKDAYYYDAVAWAVEQSITTGTSATTFSPDRECTEIEILTFLW